MSTSRLAALLTALAMPAATDTGEFVALPGSTLSFEGRFEDEAFEGRFRRFDARIAFDPVAPAAAVIEVEIELGSADTGLPERDEMLREPGFFAVASAPTARYAGRGARRLADGRYRVEGELTLRGVTRAVPLEFRWRPGAAPVLEGEAVVPRLAFGVGGEWADVEVLPDAVAVRTRLVLGPAP